MQYWTVLPHRSVPAGEFERNARNNLIGIGEGGYGDKVNFLERDTSTEQF